MINIGYDIRRPSILITLHHLVYYMDQYKWKNLMILIWIDDTINACNHNQPHSLEPLHLAFEGTIKEGTLLSLMVLL